MSKEEAAVPVNFETSLIEPEGFYAKYSNIEPKVRRLALLRIPNNISLEDMAQIAQISLSSSSKSSKQYTVATFSKENATFDVVKCAQEGVPANVLVPGRTGLTAAKIDEMWRLQRRIVTEEGRKGSDLADGKEETAGEVDWDGDVGIGAVGKAKKMVNKRAQPSGLKMNLSAVDVDTVISKKRVATNTDSTSSPKKKSKNK